VCSSDLSGDRAIATAQSCAEFLKRAGVTEIVADRSLPFLFAHCIGEAGIDISCEPELWVADRRMKDAQEIEHLSRCQKITEQAIEMACRLIGGAEAGSGGVLMHEGAALTSERVREAIDIQLLRAGFTTPTSIVAGGPAGSDCHSTGSGELRTGEPVIVDIFPCERASKYNGDCTRTVVHGEIPDEVRDAHAAVVRAKKAALDATRPGATGEDVHRATISEIEKAGYAMGPGGAGATGDSIDVRMVHGTGHGVGLEVHEPPLLDLGGPKLVVGDCLTIEPGLYCPRWGGIRVEDMVIVTESGCDNLNSLPEGLEWV